MASGLLRDPRQGRVWYPPARIEIPRAVGRAELVDRLYREGGPKHGLRQRKDAIETLWRGYTYLRLRAQREDSGDFATTAEQTVVGLEFELSRRGAKAWDLMVGQTLKGKARRGELLRRRGSALSKLLDELSGAGLLVWGGERDNHGLWWRLRIRLLDPDEEQPPDWEPWMRGLDAPETAGGMPRGGRAGHQVGGSEVEERPLATVDLASLYRRVEALTGHRPRLEARQVVQLRAAVRRFAANAAVRPTGTPGEPLQVLRAQIEHFAPQDESALAWALARFDGYTRQLEARTRARTAEASQESPSSPAQSAFSPNCAALFNQQLNPNVSEISALACRTGARGPVDEMHDADSGAVAKQGPGMAKRRSEGVGGPRDPVYIGAVLERVAARERRLEALSPQLRAQEARTVARARAWPSHDSLPLGLLTAAAQALAGGAFLAARPWLSAAQRERLRRAERRYVRYADGRPEGSPRAPAAVLIDLIEHAPPDVRQPLAWSIAQLDLLSKRMRREHRRTHPRRLDGRRAGRRCDQATENAPAFYRRPPPPHIQATADHLADGYLGQRAAGETAAGWHALEAELQAAGELPTAAQLEAAKRHEASGSRPSAVQNRGWRWRQLNSATPDLSALAQVAGGLHAIGVGVTAEQLRCKVRDRLLLSDGGQAAFERLKRPDAELPYTPESYDPAAPQLTGRDLERSHVWAWRRHGSRRSRIAPGAQFGAPPTS